MAAMLLIEGDVSLSVLLKHIVEEARTLAGARYAGIGVLNEDRTALARLVTTGIDGDEEERIVDCLTGRGALGRIADPAPLRLADTREHPDRFGAASEPSAPTSFLGVPVKVREAVYGNLCLLDKVGCSEFTSDDEELMIGLATAAGIAIENVRLHERVQQLAILDERDRIARDLHDSVIQRLFAVGLSVQGMVKLAGSTAFGTRLTKVVTDVDETIRQIRSTIFELGLGEGNGVRSDLLALISELNQVLGFEVRSTLNGPIDTGVTGRVAEYLLMTVREALTNVGRHAQATAAAVNLRVDHDWCRLEVVDNGVGRQAGAESAGGRQGVENLRRRAEELSGGLLLEQPEAGGTRLLWWAPVSA